MSVRTTIIISVIAILVATLASVIVYPRLPEIAASHWNAAGEVNGYMPRFWVAFLMPLISVGLLLLLLLVPSLDPLKANIATFRPYYNAFIALIIVFLLFIHGITLAWNLGYDQFNIGDAILPAVGLIMIFAGVLMAKAKRNFFIGIRTPWTLSNDTVDLPRREFLLDRVPSDHAGGFYSGGLFLHFMAAHFEILMFHVKQASLYWPLLKVTTISAGRTRFTNVRSD
jgi:uncharacterized membrane protein